MALVVCVHGIAQQGKGEDVLLDEWLRAMRSGLRRTDDAGERALHVLEAGGVACAFYGDVFRPPGRPLGIGDPFMTAEDATDYDTELLMAWWEAAAESDPAVIHPDTRVLARTPRSVQAALRALSGSRFFAGVAERALLFDLVQVRRYFTEPDTRAAIQARIAAAVDDDTRVIIGHSLGSVVAYEALAAHPEWPVRTLVTLGSPLGIRNLIFDRLDPAPEPFPQPGQAPGRWPGALDSWTNVADEGDVIALVKDLKPVFGPRLTGWLVNNGATAHAVSPYLTAAETGRALAVALTDPHSTAVESHQQ